MCVSLEVVVEEYNIVSALQWSSQEFTHFIGYRICLFGRLQVVVIGVDPLEIELIVHI